MNKREKQAKEYLTKKRGELEIPSTLWFSKDRIFSDIFEAKDSSHEKPQRAWLVKLNFLGKGLSFASLLVVLALFGWFSGNQFLILHPDGEVINLQRKSESVGMLIQTSMTAEEQILFEEEEIVFPEDELEINSIINEYL